MQTPLLIMGFLVAFVMKVGAEHWAFLPPVRTALPTVRDVPWTRSEIDYQVLAALEAANQAPSPTAPRSVLIRRLSQDLLGLPADVDLAEAFLSDTHPQATERLVDRLLASPAYGERQAQHWLDLARYADTTGHAADMPRTMWLFRDWVIDAINQNQPFDAFTIEQLAGDLLPHPTEAQRIASGFHRNSMQALGNNPRKEEYRVKGIVDRLDVTGQVWLGLTVACAECHDHKYDPLSTREYYQLFAIFNNIPHEGEKFEVHGPRMDVERSVNGTVTTVQAQIMEELAEPRVTRVFLRGNFETPGERVEPGLPAMLPALGERKPLNRLSFAEWLVDEKHPLTARVTVNREWQYLFRQGLAESPNDFGLRSKAPSHQALLDGLAIDFRTHGWDRKWLQRRLVTSAVYTQSAAASPEARQRDPKNRLLGRAARFRLSAEQIRDQALSAAGLLVREIGGPSVYPPQPSGVGAFRDATAGTWKVSVGADRYRRALYTFWQRMSPHPSMTTFDAPNRETCTVRREQSNTPLQALVTLNDPAFIEAAEHFGRRLSNLQSPFHESLIRAFQTLLARKPTPVETARFQGFWEAQNHDWTAVAMVILNLDETLSRE